MRKAGHNKRGWKCYTRGLYVGKVVAEGRPFTKGRYFVAYNASGECVGSSLSKDCATRLVFATYAEREADRAKAWATWLGAK